MCWEEKDRFFFLWYYSSHISNRTRTWFGYFVHSFIFHQKIKCRLFRLAGWLFVEPKKKRLLLVASYTTTNSDLFIFLLCSKRSAKLSYFLYFELLNKREAFYFSLVIVLSIHSVVNKNKEDWRRPIIYESFVK